jgi:hypothetical protein
VTGTLTVVDQVQSFRWAGMEAMLACRAGQVVYADAIELLFWEGLERQELRDYLGVGKK